MKKSELFKILPVLFAAAAVGAVFYASNAEATKPKPPPQEQVQGQTQGQTQGQNQETHVTTNNPSNAVAKSAGGNATNEGNSLSVESNYESGPSDVLLVLQQHTVNCMRTYGISFGNKEGGGGLGWPFRDKTCDLEAAADDAFAQGNITLGWVFKCKQKNLRKAFGGEQECLAAVARPDIVTQLEKRVDVLTEQKETLLRERQFDQERCKESKNRILEGCVKK